MEDYGTNRPSSGNYRGENKPFCKQEGGEEQLRSRKGGEYDDLVVLSERGRRRTGGD